MSAAVLIARGKPLTMNVRHAKTVAPYTALVVTNAHLTNYWLPGYHPSTWLMIQMTSVYACGQLVDL